MADLLLLPPVRVHYTWVAGTGNFHRLLPCTQPDHQVDGAMHHDQFQSNQLSSCSVLLGCHVKVQHVKVSCYCSTACSHPMKRFQAT